MTPRHPHIRRRPTLTAAALLALAGAASAQPSTLPFPAVFELADLLPVNGGDGSLGFVINGIEQYDISGRSLSSAGDVNGDGFDDLIIGAQAADANGQLMAGQSYVVFGGPGVGASGSLELASLNGLNGFVINGFDTDDRSGYSVASAGDVNGDGVDDVVIGADLAEPNGQFRAGECYVVFGGPTVGAGGSVELASLDGTDGFVLSGLDANDVVGLAISSAGDVNGDGVGDLIIGAAGGDPNGQSAAGESYLVFGGPSVGAGGSLDLASLNGINGFVINGIDVDDQSGRSVASAGDVNGDGADDVIIGATVAGPNGQSRAGESYVIFGAPGVGAGGTLDLSSLDGTDGFVLNGIDAYDQSGFPVASAGDVNGDGVDDVIIGARSADPNGLGNAGESYIVFGGPSVGAGGSLDLASLDGTNGLVLNGIDEQDLSGGSVASAGDVNGDGIDDVIIGARSADPNGQAYAGETYVVFGRPGIGASGSLNLSSSRRNQRLCAQRDRRDTTAVASCRLIGWGRERRRRGRRDHRSMAGRSERTGQRRRELHRSSAASRAPASGPTPTAATSRSPPTGRTVSRQVPATPPPSTTFSPGPPPASSPSSFRHPSRCEHSSRAPTTSH
jgi:hypothetical protein